MTIDNDIQKILGVVPPPPPPAPEPKKMNWKDWAPARPEPLYQFTVSMSKSQYGTVTVHATDKHDAQEQGWHNEPDDWEDGDVDIYQVDKDDEEPVNQADIESWDDQYGAKYDIDGQPLCSECGTTVSAAAELTSNAEGDRWFCASCLSN